MSRRLARPLLCPALLILLAAGACHRGQAPAPHGPWAAPGPEQVGNVTAPKLDASAAQAFNREEEEKRATEQWAQRDARVALEASLNAYERLSTLSPNDPNLAIRLSRGYFLYGSAHLEGANERAARRQAFVRGMLFGEHALAQLSEPLAQELKAGRTLEASLQVLGAETLPAMMWYTANLASFARHSGVTTLMFYRARLEGLIERMVALDEKFCYGAPRLFYALWLARAPSFIGGNLSASRAEFERALKLAPDYFGNAYAFALNYAVPQRDQALFRQLLDGIVQGRAESLVEMAPEMRITQGQAQSLLARESTLF